MRCYARVKIGQSSYLETYCYEPLNDAGECSLHGQRLGKPEWMSEEQWQTHVAKSTPKIEVITPQKPIEICKRCNPEVPIFSQKESLDHDIKFHNRQWKG